MGAFFHCNHLFGRSGSGVALLLLLSVAARGEPDLIIGSPKQPVAGAATTSQVIVVPPQEDKALQVDALVKEAYAKPNDESCAFHFALKNTSSHPIVINQIRTSCGCTVAKMPTQPWKLAPGEGGVIELTIDLRGKSGILVKTATIDTATTFKTLTIKVTIPPGEAAANNDGMRSRNTELAMVDRQAVFRGECAKCHAEPSKGLEGRALYVAACAVCHEGEHRASIVPDLHALTQPTHVEYWRTIIVDGKAGTLMPAFGLQNGGPLNPTQINTLVEFLTAEFPPAPLRKR
jgi:hypothetical protein